MLLHTGDTYYLFDRFISENYNLLYGKTKKFIKDKDLFHDTLVKVRIKSTGFTVTDNIYAYTYKALLNNTREKERNAKKNKELNSISIDDLDLTNLIEDLDDKQLYYDDLNFFYNSVFNYLRSHYSERDALIFSTYYSNSNETHKTISEASNLSYQRIKGIISTIKKDLKLNIWNYISTKQKNIPFVRTELPKRKKYTK